MKILTEKEFRNKYGEVGVAQFDQITQPKKEGYFSRVGADIKSRYNEMGQTQLANEQSGGSQPFSTGANIAKNLSGMVLAPLAQAPVVKQVGELFGKAGEAIVNTPYMNKVTDELSQRVSPQTLGTVSDTMETGLNVSGIYGGLKGGKAVYEKGKTTVNSIKENINKPPAPPEPPDPQVRLDAAIKDATPDYESSTPTGKGKLLDRTKEGGLIKGRSVTPNALEVEAGTELSKITEYDTSSTKLAKYQAAKTEVGKRGRQLETDLGNEKVVVPKKEVAARVQKAVNELPNKSLLLQSSDPVIVNYMRVFKNAFANLPGTLKGVLQLRKALDAAYENARGKQAFGSDKISALDDVNTAVRDTLYDYLVENAQSTDVIAGLRSQWNLFRAIDMLRVAAEKESGSALGRKMQQYPMTTKIIKSVGNATGIGGAMNVIGGPK